MKTVSQTSPKDFKLLGVFTGVFSAALVISTVTSSKIAMFGPFAIPAGFILFPVTFILNDIITEVYGYARARRVVWTALGAQLLAAAVFLIADNLPPAIFWSGQDAFHTILGFAPRIALAGVLAFFFGELANSFVISKMKYSEEGKRGLTQGWRFVASTLVGEAVDSLIFMTVAFVGVIPIADLFTTMLTLYVAKVLYEIVALPLSVPLSNWLKKKEGIDHTDHPEDTDYNPFAFLK